MPEISRFLGSVVFMNCNLNTICWENEADFAPEFLYELGQRQALAVGPLQRAA